MNEYEKSFREAEEKWLSPPEEETLYCEQCGNEICEGNYYYQDNCWTLCEGCAVDRLYDKMIIA